VRLGLAPDRPTVLVFGGSQGARSINRAVAGAASRWRALGAQVIHLAGSRGRGEALEAWRWAGVDPDDPQAGVRLIDQLADMSDAYASADLVVCRAGATSIAELTTLGLPSLLVPYPHAAADHQQANADALAAVGAAVVLTDADLSADRLADEVTRLLADPLERERMSRAARAWGRPDAAEALAAVVLEVLDRTGPGAARVGRRVRTTVR
jgi:UDP-N-acetylglucosamine--N-acetylmuramyl-(pentapeptide) pyrophosphoryl-undecaprenol N-acetylglucosamine transferase